jgi:hypothetical protein
MHDVAGRQMRHVWGGVTAESETGSLARSVTKIAWRTRRARQMRPLLSIALFLAAVPGRLFGRMQGYGVFDDTVNE